MRLYACTIQIQWYSESEWKLGKCICFCAASELVNWCLSAGEVESRAEATKIGQVRGNGREERGRAEVQTVIGEILVNLFRNRKLCQGTRIT